MTKAEKKLFIKNFTKTFVDEFISKIDKVPEDWDGIEIRTWLADTVSDEARRWEIKQNPKGKRARKYRNDIAISEL